MSNKLKAVFSRPFQIAKLLWQRFFEHNIIGGAAQTAYFFILAIFPFLIFFNALVASLHIPSAVAISFLEPIFPQKIVSFITSYLELINSQSGTSILSFGIVLVIYASSSSVRSLISAFNKAYETEQKRSIFSQILFSMMFIVLFAFMMIAFIIILAFGNDVVSQAIGKLSVPLAFIDLFSVWRWVTMSAILFVILTILYKVLPSVKVKFRETLPGTLFALIGFIVLTELFSFYVNNVISVYRFYGSFGAAILIMLWMYFVGAILMLGAELNKIVNDLKK